MTCSQVAAAIQQSACFESKNPSLMAGRVWLRLLLSAAGQRRTERKHSVIAWNLLEHTCTLMQLGQCSEPVKSVKAETAAVETVKPSSHADLMGHMIPWSPVCCSAFSGKLLPDAQPGGQTAAAGRACCCSA